VEVVISAKLPDISRPQFHLPLLGALAWWHAWRCLVAKVGTSNQDRTISLKAAVCSCTNKQTFSQDVLPYLYFLIPPSYQPRASFSLHVYELLFDVCKLSSQLLVQWWWHSTHEHATTIVTVKVKLEAVCSSETLVPMVGIKMVKVRFNFSGVHPLMM
jgi:hypothetical protein